MNTLLNNLKDTGTDFEWYPTTDRMIQSVAAGMRDARSVMDIGAGDGRVLVGIQKAIEQRRQCHNIDIHAIDDLYAIEKAPLLIDAMPAGISIIGTDFHMQSLIDKEVDVIFCNPPYKEYEDWAVKIIREGFCQQIFLVIPQRWKESQTIQAAIKSRNALPQVIYSGDFLSADRASRANIDIVRLNIPGGDSWDKKRVDPFAAWFKEVFPEFDKLAEKEKEEDRPLYGKQQDPRFKTIVPGQNIIERLEELYRADMDKYYQNYRALCGMDAELLKELGVEYEDLVKGLKAKIKGLKELYWHELFDHLDKITSRLTKVSREAIYKQLRGSTNIDYTAENAYAVVLWIIKNANQYINSQIIALFKDMSSPDNVTRYKSNQKTWGREEWRFKGERPTHYALEYRIILERYRAIKTDQYSCNYKNNLHDDAHVFINDIFTVANNLGFSTAEQSDGRQWQAGEEQIFRSSKGVLAAIRAHKNGNIHIKFDQEFIKTLNVEASRLLGWIKSPQEAAQEIPNITRADAEKVWNKAQVFLPTDARKLLSAS